VTGSIAGEGRSVGIAALRTFLETALGRLDVPAADAEQIAGVLVDAELRGYESHGAFALERLIGWYRSGGMNPRPAMRTVSESQGALLLDADRGCGVMAAFHAMRWCVSRARALGGMAYASIIGAGYAVAAAPYVELAAREGTIGFACMNSGPIVAPPGGTTRIFATNPLAYGLPTRRHRPVVLDMAVTGTAWWKTVLLQQAGEALEEGLALDKEGRPTTDPQDVRAGGSLLPIGWPHAAHKGFGLAMVVDALSGVLGGAGFARGANPGKGDAGLFLWALDPSAFGGDAFRARMDEQIDQIKSSHRTPGVEEILVPGERGQRRREELSQLGTVPISESVWRSMAAAAQSLEVPLPE
jgi:ureidoglycolate dehydrogenase (NAD+)